MNNSVQLPPMHLDFMTMMETQFISKDVKVTIKDEFINQHPSLTSKVLICNIVNLTRVTNPVTMQSTTGDYLLIDGIYFLIHIMESWSLINE